MEQCPRDSESAGPAEGPKRRPGPTVAVIVAAHNADETLAETLESLLGQSHRDWEAIVVDDGSTDRTAELTGGYAKRDERIRLIRQEQAGESSARNAGISLALSEWLLFLDSDDWLQPEALARLTGALVEDPGVDVAYSGWGRVTPDGQLASTHVWSRPAEIFASLARTNMLAVHSCLVRRSMVEELGGFDASLRTCEDWDLWQRLACRGARFQLVTEDPWSCTGCARARSPRTASG